MFNILKYTLKLTLLGFNVHELKALEISNLPEYHFIYMHETKDYRDVGSLEGF